MPSFWRFRNEASLFNQCSAQGAVPVEQKLIQRFLNLSLSFFGGGLHFGSSGQNRMFVS